MTPAIVSAETFLKLSEASKNWCLMVKPTKRTNTVLDALNALLGAEQDAKSLNETIIYAFELLWLNGLKPKLEYEEQVWNNSQSLEDAIKEYTARIGSTNDLAETQKKEIGGYLESIAVDGMVYETSHTLITAMYWQV